MLKLASFVLAASLGAASVHAASPAAVVPATPVPAAPMSVMPMPSAPTIAAKAHLLIDYRSGKVLAGDNVDMRVEPASITKLMTAYIVYGAMQRGDLTPDTLVTISEKAWRMQGSKMFVRVGNQVKVDDLLKGLIIQSGNDATIALAEHIAGSEEAFVNMMNHEAQRLGMTSTLFANSTGWPDANHYSTARDLAILMAAVIRDFPEQYVREREKEFTWNNIKQHNRNRLLWRDPTVDGGKTGHTESAGYCLVASAERDGMRLVSVVLGAASDDARAEQSLALLNYGFRFYETRLLRRGGETLAEPRVWQGENKNVPIGLSRDFYVTAPRGQFDKLNLAVDMPQRIDAPVAKGQSLAMLRARLGNEVLAEVPVVALNDVPEGGLIRRMVDGALLMLE